MNEPQPYSGNMKETFGKDRACGSRDMHVCVRAFITRRSYSLSSHEDRQTHTHRLTHHYTLQPLPRAKQQRQMHSIISIFSRIQNIQGSNTKSCVLQAAEQRHWQTSPQTPTTTKHTRWIKKNILIGGFLHFS